MSAIVQQNTQQDPLDLEPNPFEQSFAAPDALLPSVAQLASPAPSSSTAQFNSWGPGSLRNGPLSPAMLQAPQSTAPTAAFPNESAMRSGLTPLPYNDPLAVFRQRESSANNLYLLASAPTQRESPPRESPVRARVRARKKSEEKKGEEQKETEEDKRRNFLERNRVAALKCRQRKKQWLSNLQSKVEFYAHENDQLAAQIAALRDEVVNLKALLIAHKDCPVAKAQGLDSLLQQYPF